MVRAGVFARMQQRVRVQKQHGRILGGDHADQHRLVRDARIRFGKGLPRADAAEHAAVAPHIPQCNDRAPRQHHPHQGGGSALRQNGFPFLEMFSIRLQTRQQRLGIPRGDTAKQGDIFQRRQHKKFSFCC